jgi:hypothetical protein
VTLHLETTGTARAVKPVYFGPLGVRLGETTVIPEVTSNVSGISARNDLVRQFAGRRASHPISRATMDAEARTMTVANLKGELDGRVAAAIQKAHEDFKQLQQPLSRVAEVLAPLAREGATPYFDSARSSATSIELNAYARARDQFGAAAVCPITSLDADVLLRIHVSAANNMGETITGGKRLADSLLMQWAQVLYEELPLPLMVHSRAKRWAVVMRKQRPIEVQIPEANQFLIRLEIDSLEIDDQLFAAASSATIRYRLAKNDLGEYQLNRDGGVQLQTTAPDEARLLLHEKLTAFFGPVLNAGGLVIPEGGVLGALKRVESKGIHAEAGWIVAGLDVPTTVIEELLARTEHGKKSP